MRTKKVNFQRLIIPLITAGIIAMLAPQSHAQTLNEDAIKANYILRFIDFIRSDRPAGPAIRIGLVDSENLLVELNTIVAKRTKDKRKFEIVQIDSQTKQLDQFHLVYVGRGHQDNWTTLLEAARNASVITVSSETNFIKAGGIIEFIPQNNRLRFALNLSDADDYNLSFSSKLIQLSIR